MPFNGSGVYSAPAADFPVVTQTVISSTHFNNTINDIATALSTCLTKDGQQTATANINFGGFRATNVGITGIAGSVGTPAINVSDVGTGLYRSAASELAVTVAGSQVARFASTGLIVIGAASVSTTLTASTSVATPAVGTAAATLALQASGATQWNITAASLSPAVDNTATLGTAALRIASTFTGILDSGTTSSLLIKTNGGTTQVLIDHVASAVNTLDLAGGAIGNAVTIDSRGTDANPGLDLRTKGSGTIGFRTDVLTTNVVQFQVLHTASATRNITVTGSNGGNPTLDVTGGNLAITPAIVVAGAFISVGGTPASAGGIRLPVNIGLESRNAANSGDVSLVQGQTINGAADVVVVGSGGSGVVGIARSSGAAPTTTDLAAGRWAVWRDTVGATTKLYYNNAGVIQSIALA